MSLEFSADRAGIFSSDKVDLPRMIGVKAASKQEAAGREANKYHRLICTVLQEPLIPG